MFNEEIDAVSKSAHKKIDFLKNDKLGYFFSSILGGAYIALGVVFAFSVGAMLKDMHGYKLIIGICFSVGLTLVYIAGSELFTGNNFVMAVGAVKKTVSWLECIKVWVMCYLGNIVGSLIIVLLFFLGGFLKDGYIPEFFIKTANAKIHLTPIEIVSRGILCNILVSLATWCYYKCKSETGKIIMIILCVTAFITLSFEHSVANMSLLTIGAISPSSDITIVGIVYNIFFATIGNILGGALFVGLPYLVISKKR